MIWKLVKKYLPSEIPSNHAATYVAKKPTWTVQYDANGGSIYQGSSTKILANGESYGELPYASREDFHFIGWYTSAEGGSKVSDGDIFTSSMNITLYAHWEDYIKTGINNVYRMVASPTGTGSNFVTDVPDVGVNTDVAGKNIEVYYKTNWDGAEGDNFVRFIDAGDGYVYIQPINTTKVFDVTNGDVEYGTKVILYDLHYSTNQKWKIKKVPGYKNHYVFLSALNENYCLDRDDSSNVYAAQKVQICPYNNNISQAWEIDDVAISSAYTFLREKTESYYNTQEFYGLSGWYMQATSERIVKVYLDGNYYGNGWVEKRTDVTDTYPYHTGGETYNTYCGWHAQIEKNGLPPGEHTMTVKIYDQFNQYLNYSSSYTFNVSSQ